MLCWDILSFRDFPASLPEGTQKIILVRHSHSHSRWSCMLPCHIWAPPNASAAPEKAQHSPRTQLISSENRYAGNFVGHSPHLQVTSTFQVNIFCPDIGLQPSAFQRREGRLGIWPPAQPPSRAPRDSSNAEGWGCGRGSNPGNVNRVLK